jgi:hypothetical protein
MIKLSLIPLETTWQKVTVTHAIISALPSFHRKSGS